MHESTPDEKWSYNDDPDGMYDDLKRRYEELKRQHEELLAATTELSPVEAQVGNTPSEESLIVVMQLMRLYDIGMALLNHFDKPTADTIYEAHNKGDHFNPMFFIPKFGDQ